MSKEPQNFREVEKGIHTDLKGRMNYGQYLHLDEILNAQHCLSKEHDEMLFIIIHQASELWLKLAGHEVEAAIRNVQNDNFRHAFKVIARVKLILTQLTQSWSILSTMTPVDYLKFRDELGPASGFQSYAYRKLEFLLGNKNRKLVDVHRHDQKVFDEMSRVLEARSMRIGCSATAVSPMRQTTLYSAPGPVSMPTPKSTSSCTNSARNSSISRTRSSSGASSTCIPCSALSGIAGAPAGRQAFHS
jgi:hypothetical protein